MSEHEGFCVPLVEAMYHDVPIIAYAAAAVPDTLGDAGLLLNTKDFPVIAECAALLTTDDAFRERILARQRRRLDEFRPQAVAGRLRTYLKQVMAA
jgi:glycosyltransferase involved in cell wall biosynthesis